jgi:hypothetical protein
VHLKRCSVREVANNERKEGKIETRIMRERERIDRKKRLTKEQKGKH